MQARISEKGKIFIENLMVKSAKKQHKCSSNDLVSKAEIIEKIKTRYRQWEDLFNKKVSKMTYGRMREAEDILKILEGL